MHVFQKSRHWEDLVLTVCHKLEAWFCSITIFWHAGSWMVTQKKVTQFSLALTYEALLQSSQQTPAVLLCVYPRLTPFWVPELSHLCFLQSKALGIIQVCAPCALTNHSPENTALSTPFTLFPHKNPLPLPPRIWCMLLRSGQQFKMLNLTPVRMVQTEGKDEA